MNLYCYTLKNITWGDVIKHINTSKYVFNTCILIKKCSCFFRLIRFRICLLFVCFALVLKLLKYIPKFEALFILCFFSLKYIKRYMNVMHGAVVRAK